MPTGIIVACQAERSQHKNRATALKMLKARLYEMELQKQQEKIDAANAKKTDIGWGHQIRSYVLQPYQLVKDLRTGHTSTSPGRRAGRRSRGLHPGLARPQGQGRRRPGDRRYRVAKSSAHPGAEQGSSFHADDSEAGPRPAPGMTTENGRHPCRHLQIHALFPRRSACPCSISIPRLYVDPAVLPRERNEIFARTWQMLGPAAQVAERGQYVSADIAGIKVFAIRGRDGALRAFRNVCRHRGAQLLEEGTGRCATIRCPYHQWVFADDGRLLNAPWFGDGARLQSRRLAAGAHPRRRMARPPLRRHRPAGGPDLAARRSRRGTRRRAHRDLPVGAHRDRELRCQLENLHGQFRRGLPHPRHPPEVLRRHRFRGSSRPPPTRASSA